MKQFKNKKNGFKEIRNQTLIRTIPLLLLAAVGGILISEFNQPNTSASDINILPIMIPIILGALAVGMGIGIKRQKAIYETYELIIDEISVTRSQSNTPTIKILFREIKKITKNNKGGIIITGNNLLDKIIVPSQIEDIEGFENILQANSPVQISRSKPIIQRLLLPLVVVQIGLMATVYISTNKLFVAMSGTVLFVFLLGSLIMIQKNKNIDKRTRRSSYWIIVVLLSIIGIMINKLMN
ncbi:MAG: hypothetical protein WCR72_15980 [Bacteroidota bacterium]